MQEPDITWTSLRLAVLERAQRKTTGPLKPVYSLYALASIVYLFGFAGLHALDTSTWNATFLLLLAVPASLAGALIPFLTGSVLTLRFAERGFVSLLDE